MRLGGHAPNSAKIAVHFLVGVLLVDGDELVVEVKIDAISGIELAGGGETPQKQRVHLLVHVEGVGLLLVALVGDAALGKVPQRPEDDIR